MFPDSSSLSFHFKPWGSRVWETEPGTFVFAIAAREAGHRVFGIYGGRWTLPHNVCVGGWVQI